MSDLCPCCSQKNYIDCCDFYLSQNLHAPTPEALMRSRYTAFVRANIDYIAATMCGSALSQFSYDDSLQWARQSTWLRLEVLNTEEINPTEAMVEFKAYYLLSGIEKCLHEKSLFHFIDGKWFYVGSEQSRQVDKRAGAISKVGRNDPCSCGSGQKYKKCCYGKGIDG